MCMSTLKYKPSMAVSVRFVLDIIIWFAVMLQPRTSQDNEIVCVYRYKVKLRDYGHFYIFITYVSAGTPFGIPVILLYLQGNPVEVGFFCDDTSLKYPYRKSTVSDEVLLGTSLGGVVTMMVLTEFLLYLDKRNRTSTSWPVAHIIKHLGVFLLGFTINELFTSAIKQRVGRLRPHFFDVCKPDFKAINCSQGYITGYTCMNTHVSQREIKQSRLSFPSGHASLAMYSAVYIGYYIQVHMRVTYSNVLKPVLQSVLVLLAVLNGLTRITDHMHHPIDVIAGYFFGAVIASFAYGTLGLKIQKASKFICLQRVPLDQKVSETCDADFDPAREIFIRGRTSLQKKYLDGREFSCETTISVLEKGNEKEAVMDLE